MKKLLVALCCLLAALPAAALAEGTLTLPEEAAVIEAEAFRGLTGVSQIDLPVGVVEIGADAFDGCALLHGGAEENVIRIPNTVVTAGSLAFQKLGGGYAAERFFLVLPASLTEFDISIFNNCNAVLVAPAGSTAASVLYNSWYYYYTTLEDAAAGTNAQYRRYYEDGIEQQHVHYGRL